MKLKISAKKVFKILATITLLFVSIHLLFMSLKYSTFLVDNLRIVDKFDLDRELNIPTWYNQTLFLIAALFLFIVYRVKKSQKDSYSKYWFFLSFIFVYCSLDEGAAIHEMASLPTKKFLGIEEDPGFLANAWVVPVSILVLILVAIYFKFYLSLPKKTKILFFLAFFIFIFGAVGMDIYVTFFEYGTFVFNGIIIAIEEGFEMLGISIFIYALIDYLKTSKVKTSIDFIE